MLFSATYVDEVVNFAKAIIKDPVMFRLRREDETLKNIRQVWEFLLPVFWYFSVFFFMNNFCSLYIILVLIWYSGSPRYMYSPSWKKSLVAVWLTCVRYYILQMYVECRSSEEKYEAISNIFSIPVGSAMFFCHTKHTANWLAKRLSEDGYQVGLLTGMVVTVLCYLTLSLLYL